MIHHQLIFCIVVSSILSACSTTPPHNQPFMEQANQAETLMNSGQPKEAARLYQNLAETNRPHQNQFRLLAAEALAQSGDNEKARQYADSIDPSILSPREQSELNLIYAQIDLNYGNAEQALDRLKRVYPLVLKPSTQQSYYQALAFAYSLSGDLLSSARARIKLGRLLKFQNQLDENNDAILETLSLLPRQTLILDQPPPPDTLGGWMALANLLKRKEANNDDFNAKFNAWQQMFPNHPANSDFLQHYLAHPKHAFKIPTSIAILLPQSGPLSQAAKAIREGLMAAYYQHQDLSPQPTIRFYDSGNENPVILYNQAVAENAEMIIGPLSKKNIEILVANTELVIPVLALNHIENLSRENLYQFGLSPIDEARQITEKAWQDGHRQALVLTPESRKGNRVANYLSESWQLRGGNILEIQSYNPKQHDFSYPIKNLLNLNESEQRYRRLKRLLARNLEFTPRRRHDVDAIFINAYPRAGRSLNPQLKFYHATDIPVYAMPQIYTGQHNASQDIDLDKITFCDIPWLFPETYQGELSLQSLQEDWQQAPDSYLRLIALGIDAYNLIAHLDKLDTIKYHGTTGNLLLNSENRITRQLVCAKFTQGIPVSLGFIDTVDEVYTEDVMDENFQITPYYAE